MQDIIDKYNQLTLSQKQREYIEKLSPGTDTHDISKKDASVAIRKAEADASLTRGQINLLEKYFTLEKCSSILNRQISSYDEVKLRDFKIIIQPLQKFPLYSQDTPIVSVLDYEYGWQKSELCQNNKLYYLRFYDLLMIDIDHKNIDTIKDKIIKSPETFRIYETHKGYHIFVMTRPINHNDPTANHLMQYFECDSYYIRFSYKNGFKVRLNKKIDREEQYVCKFVRTVGKREYPECLRLIKIHDEYISKFEKGELPT